MNQIEDLIGNTPLVELKNIQRKLNLKSRIFAKLECFNLSGSVKARIAKAMIDDAEESGRLKDGGTIIEPTSGNTGIALSMIAAIRGYKMITVMPESMSVERRQLIKAYGSELVLTPAGEGMKGAIAKANEIQANTPNSIVAKQFSNPANPLCHYKTTAPEILRDLNGIRLDYFVAGIGTGGTITGCSKFFKEKKIDFKSVGVEPLTSAFLTTGKAGKHIIQGIGAGFAPDVLDRSYIDEIRTASNEDALAKAQMLAKVEGIFSGISAGAATQVAIQIALENENKNIVVILPDSGDKYLSIPNFIA